MTYDVIIIGGGAAGCFAAALLRDFKTAVIEKHSPMKKLLITGKGRCNLTNNRGVSDFLANVPKNAAFMRSSVNRFTPADAMSFFENELKIPLKTERGNRVFPVSDKSADIVNALKNRVNAEIIRDRAREIIIENGAAVGVKCENGVHYAKKILLAVGGCSYPATGSTGDGYKIAEKAGHTVIPPKPALVPLVTEEDCSPLEGLTLKNVRLTLKKNNNPVFGETGEMLFTDFGVTGPLVLSASCYADSFNNVLSIDFKPALDEKTLDNRLLRDFAENKNRQLKNSLSALLPARMIPVFIKRSRIPPDKKINEITREERRFLLSLLKDFTLSVKGTRPFEEAVITNGGVSVKEIAPKTMESKLVKNLHFAGEIIDVIGMTGGFNLQIAWSTAHSFAEAVYSACSGESAPFS